MQAVQPKTDCPHVVEPSIKDIDFKELLSKSCSDCDSNEENWVCMDCFKPSCSRYINGHFVKHNESQKHNIGLSLADLSFWCFECDSYIEHPILKTVMREVHEAKFGHYPDEITVEEITEKLKETTIEEQECDPIKSVADVISSGKAKKVVVLTGAGLSTAAGIPDFRTPGTGLYDNLQKYDLPHPTAIFEIGFFLENPKPFYEIAKDFIAVDYKPTPAHYFIKLLENKGLLHRVYTQNVDALELKADISREKLIQAHGSYDTSTCTDCHKKFNDMSYIKQFLLQDDIQIPICDECKTGLIKPDVILFGESLPQRFTKSFVTDFGTSDLLIVIGTSLSVYPVAHMVEIVPPGSVRCLINMDRSGPFKSVTARFEDHFIGGDINQSVWKLVDALGWRDELQQLIDNGHRKLE